MTQTDVARRLTELTRLRSSGAIDDSEFTLLKRSLLELDRPPQPAGSPDPVGVTRDAAVASRRTTVGTENRQDFRTPRSRSCPYCSTTMDDTALAECPSCGWERGLIPISTGRTTDGNTTVQFAVEPRIRGGRLGLVVFTLGGFIFFLAGMGANVLLGLAGLATLALGIYACVVTRFASYRYGLSPGVKAIALTVIFIGRFLVWCSIIGILVNVVVDSAFRD
jgi:hypothetical protein